MKKYFFLQLKRVLGYMPYVLGVSTLVFLALWAALWGVLSNHDSKQENQKIIIGVTGDTHDKLLQMGLAAFQALDETKYTIDLQQFSQDEAHRALAEGDIAAYVVMPENFVRQALSGTVNPVRFVTTTRRADIVTLFKDEILQIITDIVVASQKGTYGIGDALRAAGHGEEAGKHINKIALEYLSLVLTRSDGVIVEELGIGQALNTPAYYICSLSIFFLMLMGLPFGGLYCRKNQALSALLQSKGVSIFSQFFGEYLSVLLGIAATFSVLLIVPGLFCKGFGVPELLKDVSIEGGYSPFSLLLPLLLITAFSYMIFSLSENVIGGLLSHFFLTVALCYISGCFYPIYAFPESVQKVAKILPVCVLREQMAPLFTGGGSPYSGLWVLLYTAGFLGIGLICRYGKSLRHGGK